MSPLARAVPLWFMLLSMYGFVLPNGAWAHKLKPAVVDVIFTADGVYRVEIRANMEAVLAGIGPRHGDTADAPQANLYEDLRELPPQALAQEIERFAPEYLDAITMAFDGRRAHPRFVGATVPEVGDVRLARISTVTLEGETPVYAKSFSWRYASELGNNVLKLHIAGQDAVRSHWLTDGAASEPFALDEAVVPKSRWKVATQYTGLGFTHILPLGLDHILFVVGIFLLSFELAPLLWQVTAFTVAHTITLALSIYGIVSLSPAIVEPLIAASIVYVGLENILVRELKPWRVVIVFCFGLLHGLGFAGVLTDIGLPRSEFVTALISFNVGVELGQLAVIGVAFLLVGVWFRHKRWYRQGVIIPGSLVISVIGAYWFVERLGVLNGS